MSRHPQGAFVIEFVGLPGTGKSTVARLLADRWSGSRLAKVGPRPSLRRVAQSPWESARGTFGLWPVLRSAGRSDILRRTVALRLQHDVTVSRTGADTVVFEESITHHVAGMLWQHPDTEQLRWGCLLPADGVVVALDLPLQVVRSRIATKPNPGPANRRLLAHPLDGDVWMRARDTYQQVLEESARDRPVYRVSAVATPDAIAARVESLLLDHQGTTPIDPTT